MAENYDVVILGGGTGGYVAAIRASQLGLSVALVEKAELGGTCLHRGCIPSKALLRSAEVYTQAKESHAYGIEVGEVAFNFEKINERKNNIVSQLHQGVKHLMKKGKITVYEGYGRILGPSIFSPMAGAISVELKNGEENPILIPKNVIIATGSRPRMLQGLKPDGEFILTSDEAVHLKELPKSVLIVGGGVIGVEWASMFADFGVEVTILEYAERLIPTEDQAISKEMQRLLKKKGINIETDAKVLSDTCVIDEGVTVEAECKGERQRFSAEKMLVSIGRQANIEDIGLQNTSIKTDRGVIAANEFGQTEESHIYAIGDCIGGLQLAHVASREGIIAVEHLAGLNPDPLNPELVPRCIYTSTEVASVGLTEAEAKDRGYDIKVGQFSFKAIGKALIFGDSNGFVKIIADKKTDDLLGVHMIGPHVTDLISEAALAKVIDATPWEISKAIHPHPTLSEIIGEAAMDVEGEALHG